MLTKSAKGKGKIFWHVTLLYWFNDSWRFEGPYLPSSWEWSSPAWSVWP